MTLALAASRTSRIKLGMAVITPRLRHVVATAGSLATLCSLAPGRVEAVIGSGFTAALMLGRKPAPWAVASEYLVALRSLLAGDEISRDDAIIGLKHGSRTGIRFPAQVPLYVAAHGPRGFAVAADIGDGVVTYPSHTGGYPAGLRDVHVLYYDGVRCAA